MRIVFIHFIFFIIIIVRRITFVYDLMPPAVQRLCDLIGLVLALVYLLALAWFSATTANHAAGYGAPTQGIDEGIPRYVEWLISTSPPPA